MGGATFARTARRPSGSLQLRCRRGEHLGSRQEGMVPPCPPSWVPDPGAHRAADLRASGDDAGHTATAPSRPIQLRGWFRELDGWLECWKEGVVLQGAWKGLPADGRWLRNNFPTVRLRRGVRQLDGWMVWLAKKAWCCQNRGKGCP